MTTTTPSSSSLSIAHLVIPGQVIATSSSNNNKSDRFLRGHGTYVESSSNKGNEERLISSVCGIIHRVNKLITVIPYNESIYKGNVGDLVIGRISSVSSSRWTVIISNSSCMKDAQLPLSGVHLPGGVQRLRTKQDSLNMSTFLNIGDLICSEVHKVQQNDGGSLSLHTRSHKYTKLENGILVKVPSCLIARRKSHILSMINNKIDVLWGVNGNIWLQRANTTSSASASASDTIADLQEKMRLEHSTTPISLEIRCILARLRNSIECLRIVHTMCTPENTESVYCKSLQLETTMHTTQIANMLLPENIILLTNEFRS
ncbi:hypothetical protein FRACYDRAFT_188261 [Fragilariopsis cylindrus CCMP1102]|uniref:Uncharacterized protein n=1 Tax=Fragilariopsis cylindrus CCMP1102 TaxID=635003 RepID=A0A1E7F8H2_9STRA|nr:hypothetical protein FRACYDRAFT_188261 [Fragilariopsis cylindrus CCMP1102]|eukprot:OEU14315.1 hypothetical protein FRACYDRAFT_188261 [Fragilariopsis cylindrus CCMP1102]